MQYYEKTFDWNRDDLVSQYDELPLWSSPFGLLLLDNIPLGKYKNYLDVAFGTGFPLIEISQRLGPSCKSYGIDPWSRALNRTQFKIDTLGLENIQLIESVASKIPFPDDYFDLMTSNLGINNFNNPLEDLLECNRVIKYDAPFCLTTNLIGHFQEFYDIYIQTLIEIGTYDKHKFDLEKHISHRGTIDSHCSILVKAGFEIKRVIESLYTMRYLNGSAFLNHSFISGGFLDSWRNMLDESERPQFFNRLELNLNKLSESKGELKLTIPMAYIECFKNNKMTGSLL